MLNRIDPLFVFLSFGTLVFVVLSLFGPPTESRVIRVDPDALESYMAAGGAEAVAPGAIRDTSLDALSPQDRQALIDRYVEEQALYREALAWGLDEGDLAIRRRLVQSLRFALRGDVPGDPGDDTLRAFYTQNTSLYREAPSVSFEHIYFAGDAGRKQAEAALKSSMQDWRTIGDRFAYERTFASASQQKIASIMGDDFASRIFALEPGEDWQGPVQSEMGGHLVRLVGTSHATTPPFEDLRSVVLDDWRREEMRKDTDSAVARIVGDYKADIDPAIAGT